MGAPIRVVAVAVAVVWAVAGCSGNAEVPAPASDATSSPASEPAGAALMESCDRVPEALPDGLVPPTQEWREAGDRLGRIAADGDAETREALAGLQAAVEVMASDPPSGPEFLAASERLLDAIDALADRCVEVGSTALQ